MSTEIFADVGALTASGRIASGGASCSFSTGVVDGGIVAGAEDALEDFAHGIFGDLCHEHHRFRALEACQAAVAMLDEIFWELGGLAGIGD